MSQRRDTGLVVANYLVALAHVFVAAYGAFALGTAFFLPGPGYQVPLGDFLLLGLYVLLAAGPCLGFVAGTALLGGRRRAGRTLTLLVALLASAHALFLYGYLAALQFGAPWRSPEERVFVGVSLFLLGTPSLAYCITAGALLWAARRPEPHGLRAADGGTSP
jgi:hypothetical protein